MSEQPEQREQKIPSLNDVGTRYEHLKDHLEALEFVRDRLVAKGDNGMSYSDKVRLTQIVVAIEVLKKTVDAFLGITSDTTIEYQLYRLLNSVPAKAEDIPSERGTPLI